MGAGRGDGEESAFKKYFSIFSMVLSAVLGLVGMILAILAFALIVAYTGSYTDVVDTWEQTPVAGLSVVAAAANCPSGSDYYVNNSWPGLKPGCDCEDTTNDNFTTQYERLCTSNEKSANCDDLPGTPEVELYNFNGYKFCVDLDGPNALDRPAYDASDDTCATGSRKCGGNTTDAEGVFCWPSADPCPITDLLWMSRTAAMAAGCDEILPDSAVDNSTEALCIMRGGMIPVAVGARYPETGGDAADKLDPLPLTGLPITNFVLIERDPCTLGGCGYDDRDYSDMENAYKNANPDRGYKLVSTCDGCTDAADDEGVSPDGRDIRYSRVAELTEATLYQAHPGIPSQFNGESQFTWRLEARSEILWRADCEADRLEVQDKEEQVVRVKRAQLALLFATILSFIILTCIIPLLICFGDDELDEKVKKPKCIFKVLFKIWSYSMMLLCLFVALNSLAFFSAVNSDDTPACSDPLTAETFQFLGDEFNKLAKTDVINGVAQGFGGVVDIFELIYVFCVGGVEALCG